MERARVAGRFVRMGLDGDGGKHPSVKRAAPRPAQCRNFTRARVAEALPAIVDRFVEEAKQGSVAHTKLLTSLGGLDTLEAPEAKKRPAKSVVRMLMENMAKLPKD